MTLKGYLAFPEIHCPTAEIRLAEVEEVKNKEKMKKNTRVKYNSLPDYRMGSCNYQEYLQPSY